MRPAPSPFPSFPSFPFTATCSIPALLLMLVLLLFPAACPFPFSAPPFLVCMPTSGGALLALCALRVLPRFCSVRARGRGSGGGGGVGCGGYGGAGSSATDDVDDADAAASSDTSERGRSSEFIGLASGSESLPLQSNPSRRRSKSSQVLPQTPI
ncbi:hypothetical protein B0H15DRAFT_862832 [Mycena belliarum]|uniref:Uncharacterized protein n=1 Tax=Mycena belliarum TaxID=1033014 RepID=A0AAD6TUU7_9AGAR|nr:hypothetical protein B0H15DRAFT_862832 [Mycena belliae]